MKIEKLLNINKLVFNTNDIARVLAIDKKSANVFAVRNAKKGFLVRLKKDFYILKSKFENLKENDLFRIANVIQTPSYISLTTALSYYNISTQQQRNFFESVAVKRTKSVKVEDIEFNYTLVKKSLYKGFQLSDDFFIAKPEKAFADAIYLTSMGRYNLDLSAINFNKLDKNEIKKFLKDTNKKTNSFWRDICRNYKI